MPARQNPQWGAPAGVCGNLVPAHSPLTLMVKSVQLLGAQAARLPQAGVWHRQTPAT